MSRKAILSLAAAVTMAATAHAQEVIRIGVMNDMSSVYADFQGPGSVLAAQLAVQDFGGTVIGKKIEVLAADHQNKPDIGATLARQWLDIGGVNVIVDLPNSAVAFAVNDIVREKNAVMLASGAGSSLLTGSRCSPNTVHWTYDTWAYGNGVAQALMDGGAKTFFVITADYAFGHDLEKQASDAINKRGGKIVGTVRHPIGVSDFSSYLLQAQSSGAEVVLFANAGGDQSNSMKQASEFNLGAKQKLAGLIFSIGNVPGLGLNVSKNILLVNPFYWDANEQTRKWARRYQQQHHKKQMPNDMHAGVYASVLHYLKAVAKVGNVTDGKAIVAAMKEMPTDDPLFGKGTIRADGRKLHPMYLFRVKTPEESKGEWDYLTVVSTIPADKAFRPMNEGGCSLVAK